MSVTTRARTFYTFTQPNETCSHYRETLSVSKFPLIVPATYWNAFFSQSKEHREHRENLAAAFQSFSFHNSTIFTYFLSSSKSIVPKIRVNRGLSRLYRFSVSRVTRQVRGLCRLTKSARNKEIFPIREHRNKLWPKTRLTQICSDATGGAINREERNERKGKSWCSAPVSKFIFFKLAVSSSSKRARGASNFNSAILPAMSLIIDRVEKNCERSQSPWWNSAPYTCGSAPEAHRFLSRFYDFFYKGVRMRKTTDIKIDYPTTH